MSLWSQIEDDANNVLLNSFDGLTCTAVQLKTGQSFTGFFHHTDSERDQKYGVVNVLKGSLWISAAARPAQQEQWLIINGDGTQTEVTCVSFGIRSGGLQELKVEQLTVTRFERTGLKG